MTTHSYCARWIAVLMTAAAITPALTRGLPESDVSMIEHGSFPARWTDAKADCAGAPPFQAHEYNPTFVILRQSGCTNFEKPFLYLLFGSKQAMLVDTGATGAQVAPIVQDLLRRSTPLLPLLVVHSHGHGDHTAGDAELSRLPGVQMITATPEALGAFFGLKDWPRGIAQYDLGDRIIDIVPIPGHQAASIAIYDRRTGNLLTGDTMYPGRLYVRDHQALRESVDRLVEFTATRDIAHVLGAHIENTRTPFVDYPEGTTSQPDEHALEMGRSHLLELQDALRHMSGRIERRALRDFTIWPVAP